MLGSRAIWHKGWKAVSVHPTIAGWGELRQRPLGALRHRRGPDREPRPGGRAPGEAAGADQPLVPRGRPYNGLPLLDKTAVEVLADPTRPQVAPPRDRYVYYPDAAEVPEAAAVNIRNRSYTHRGRGRRSTPRTPSGVLFSHGARFGGHALYVKDRKLKYVYNFVGDSEQIVESTDEIPTGQVILGASFEREGDGDADDRHAVAVHRRREGRRGHDHDPARQLLARRRGPQRRARPGRARHRRLRRHAARTRSPAARSRRRSSTSRASRSSTSSSRRSR